jgi:hypothetical protein
VRGALARVKALLADGVPPDDIVVVARDDASYGSTVRSRFEGFSHPANTSGIQSTRSSTTTPLKVALRSNRASRLGVGRRWRILLRCFKGFLSYSTR